MNNFILKKGLIFVIIALFFGASVTSGISIKMDLFKNNLDENTINKTILYSSSILLFENFSGTFPPDGWETDYWNENQ